MKALLIVLGVACLSLLFIFGSDKKGDMDHTVDIGVNVSDTVRSLAFYTKVIGMKRVGETWRAPKELSERAGVNSGRAFDVIPLNLACDGYVLKYKLNQSEGNIDTTSGNAREYYGFEKLGARYLSINVENVDPYIERMKKHHVQYNLVTFPNGWRVVLVNDPDGSLIEIGGH